MTTTTKIVNALDIIRAEAHCTALPPLKVEDRLDELFPHGWEYEPELVNPLNRYEVLRETWNTKEAAHEQYIMAYMDAAGRPTDGYLRDLRVKFNGASSLGTPLHRFSCMLREYNGKFWKQTLDRDIEVLREALAAAGYLIHSTSTEYAIEGIRKGSCCVLATCRYPFSATRR